MQLRVLREYAGAPRFGRSPRSYRELIYHIWD